MTMRTQDLLTRPDAFDIEPTRHVSTQSRLADDTWDLDTEDPGHPAHGVRIRWWAGSLKHGEPDEPERRLLLLFKKVGWLALADSSFGVAHKPAGLSNFASDTSRFVRFCAPKGITRLDQVSPAVVEAYCDAVIDDFETSKWDAVDDEAAVAKVLARLVRVPWAIWEARRRLERAGIAVPAVDPLSGHTPADWARRAVAAADNRVPAIPPEVFLRIANAAATMVIDHASDVIRAQEKWLQLEQSIGSDGSGRQRMSDLLAQHPFSTAGSSSLDWPRSLVDQTIKSFGPSASVNLSRLVVALRDACSILILATTGVRPTEYIAIPAGWNEAEGMPACIRKEQTPDGLMNVYLVRSRLSKGQIAPAEAEWVIGSAPAGAAVPPLAVTALTVLERLLAPWRAMSNDPVARRSMFVRIPTQGMPSKPSSIRRPLLTRLGCDLRRFYRDWVDFSLLPERSADHRATPLAVYETEKGASIQARQFRKNYSQFLLRTDSGLLPALRRQYKHTSVATLQYRYTGNSPAELTSVHDEHRIASVRAMAEMLGQGDAMRSGRLPDIITRHETKMEGRSAREMGAAEADARGLVLIPGEHGWCGIAWAPHLSRCNQLAGTASFLNSTPSFRHRNPTVCSGCSVFAADRSHLEFWRRRHAQYDAIWKEACAAGLQEDYRVADTRRRSAFAQIINLEEKTS